MRTDQELAAYVGLDWGDHGFSGAACAADYVFLIKVSYRIGRQPVALT